MDEDEYEAYKSWYLYFRDNSVNPNPPIPVPVDVDFDIELVRTDRINVVYILNLLKKAKGNAKTEEKQQDVDLIMREIERSDNDSLRLKKDIMKEFILNRFYNLPDDVDIMDAFVQFEKRKAAGGTAMTLAKREKSQVDYELISDIFNTYQHFSGVISDDIIRKKLAAYKFRLLKMTKLTKNIKAFIEGTYKEIEQKENNNGRYKYIPVTGE